MVRDEELDALGCLAGTDKSSLGHRYLGLYGVVLRPFRDAAVTVLEIGVQEGRSLALWERFFPNATIVGLDFVAEFKALERGRVRIRTGYQEDVAFLRAVAAEFPPDVVIDDGSHQASHILASLRTLWPALRPGGVYIVEDLEFHAPLRAASNRGTPPGENPTAVFSRQVQGLLQGVAPEGGEALADVDFVLAMRGAVAIGKVPAPFQASPAAVEAVAREAARIGTATAMLRAAGYIRVNSPDLAQAERAARAAVALDPDLLEARNELAVALIQAGRLEDGIDVFVAAAAHSPETGWVWRQLGEAQLRAGRLEDAERSLDRAVRLLPRDFWSHKHLSLTHEHAGRLGRALAEARIALELGRAEMPEMLGELVTRLERACAVAEAAAPPS